MAVSQISICNKALIEVGEAPITALTDNNKAARTLSAVYDMALAASLRRHYWNFATKRVALAELVGAPLYGYAKRFQLPTDCLRIMEIDLPLTGYSIEGRELLTDAATVNLKYSANITDPTMYDALFVEYFSLRLAADIAMTLTDNKQLRDDLEVKAALLLRESRTIDGQENYPEAPSSDPSWIRARA